MALSASEVDAKITEIKQAVSYNLKRLLAEQGMKQKDLAGRLGISGPAVSKLANGGNITLDSIARLCCFFHLPIEELCTLPANAGGCLSGEVPVQRPASEYDMFLGCYEGLFFDTSKPIGGDDRITPDAFAHVVFTIYKKNDEQDIPHYKVAALFNCGLEKVRHIIPTLSGQDIEGCNWEDFYHSQSVDKRELYLGDLTLTDQFVYIDVYQNSSRDIVHIILHNKVAHASSRRTEYIGGLGTMISSSRGEERMPCSQQLLISRYPLEGLSDEELAQMLYIALPQLDLNEQAEDLITWIKALYVSEGSPNPLQGLSDNQKRLAVEAQLKNAIMAQMRQNAFRYRKISSAHDAQLYRVLKAMNEARGRSDKKG